MRGRLLCRQGRTDPGRGRRVPLDDTPDRVASKGPTPRPGKDGVGPFATTLSEVALQHGDRRLGERSGALLPSLPDTVDEGARPEMDVIDVESAELSDAQSRLQSEDEERVVAPTTTTRSGLASSASTSAGTRKVTSVRSARFRGIARTRPIVAACSG